MISFIAISARGINGNTWSVSWRIYRAGRGNGSKRISRNLAFKSFVSYVGYNKYFPGQWATIALCPSFEHSCGFRSEPPRERITTAGNRERSTAHPATRRHKPINSLLPYIFHPFFGSVYFSYPFVI